MASEKISSHTDVVSRKNQDGSLILMRLDASSVFFKIDGIAAQIWSDLSEPKTVQELLSQYQNKYPQYNDKLSTDIPSLINQLKEKNLIVIHT